jgi:hypothetical protein
MVTTPVAGLHGAVRTIPGFSFILTMLSGSCDFTFVKILRLQKVQKK